ncbi:unnamed protein product [Paramecium octaurelia]|uniref:Protein kinase domain-containing protein n=1 Tax=Paramecium octaurelia TaxID=43137 RepID=A0A8S1YAT1_PAROT|nr:unnamed protein product [Paramecium octaurelia]
MDRHLRKIGNYTFDAQKDIIVEGRRGPIIKCKDNQDQVYCLKQIRKFGDNYRNEIEAFKRLKLEKQKHINTLRVYDFWEDDSNFNIITELCEFTFEQYLIQRWKTMSLNSDEIHDFLGQIVRGYQYLRRLKINVRDFTPKTILVQRLINDRMILKISDYCINENGRIDPRTRTPYYQSPELFNPKSMKIKQSDLCDIYALGLIHYMMCFKGDNIVNVEDFSKLQKFHEDLQVMNAFQCPRNSFIPVELLSLISKIVVYNPEDRINWDDLEQRLPSHFLILKDQYFVNLKSILGSGAQGSTYNTQDLKNNQQLVCKVIPNTKEGTSREKQIFDQIKGKDNENVIKIVDIIINTQDTYLIMEKCDQSLQSYLKEKFDSKQQLSENEIIEILFQIVQGYCFLKQLGVIHRDLKPDNILLKKNQQGKNVIKIIDFGVGKIIGKDVTFTEAGTPLFAAPEVLLHGVAYDYQCDIFSLGVILHYLAFQKMFKEINSRRELIEFHQSIKNRPFECQKHNNPLFTELIKKMIVYDPSKRITWEQLQVHSIFDEVRKPQTNIQPQQIQIHTLPQQPNPLPQQPYPLPQQPNPLPQPNTNSFIEIYKYIFALYNLANKIVQLFEEIEKEIMLQEQFYILKQFIIRFQLSCLICINQLQKQQQIILDGRVYQVKSQRDFSEWLQQINCQQLYDQSLKNYNSMRNIQAPQNSQIITKGLELLNELKNHFQNQDITFLLTHSYFKKFFQLVKLQILISNQSLKLKYFLLKFQNVFQEYPVQDYVAFSEIKLTLKILETNSMQNYIEGELKQNQ